MTTLPSTVYATTDTPLGNGAFTADGRLVVSHHPMYLTPVRVSVFGRDGGLSPFPNVAWNTPNDDPSTWLDAVLGLHDDSRGRVWLADMGTRSGIPAKFVVWDTVADALWRVIPIPPGTLTPYSEPNDFVVDEPRGKVYIADEGAGDGGDGSRAALIVLDIATGTAVRRLEGHDGIRAEGGVLRIDGRTVRHNAGKRQPMRVGVDGIVMDTAGTWLYLSPLNGRWLWRLRVADLLDPTLDDGALVRRLERFAAKPNSGGMAMDDAGNVYLTVIERSAIGRISTATRAYDEPVRRPDMFWPDGLHRGPDGALYCVCTQLPRSPTLARPGDQPVLPFKVFRIDPTATANASGGEVVRAAVGGVIAAVAVVAFQALWRRVGLPPSSGDPPEATEALATRLAAASGQSLSPAETVVAGTVIHLAVGAALGVGYAELAARWPAVAAGGGTAYGLGVWATVEEQGLALAGLKPPPWRLTLSEHLFAAASHVVFGAVLAATARALTPRP